MKIGVRIMPRSEVLDSQGRAIEKTLEHHGKSVVSCRVGRYVIIDLSVQTFEEATRAAKDITEFVLYNPLIETYEIERVEA